MQCAWLIGTLLVSDNLFMIVYHLTSSEFALRALRDRRLKISRVNELNNPSGSGAVESL